MWNWPSEVMKTRRKCSQSCHRNANETEQFLLCCDSWCRGSTHCGCKSKNCNWIALNTPLSPRALTFCEQFVNNIILGDSFIYRLINFKWRPHGLVKTRTSTKCEVFADIDGQVSLLGAKPQVQNLGNSSAHNIMKRFTIKRCMEPTES